MAKVLTNDQQKAVKFLEVFTTTLIKELCSMHIRWMKPKDFDDAIKATKQYWYNQADYQFFDDNLRKLQSNFIHTFDKIFKAHFELEKHSGDMGAIDRILDKHNSELFRDLIPSPDALIQRYSQRSENTSNQYKSLTKELRTSFNAIQKGCKKYLKEQSEKPILESHSQQQIEDSNAPFCLTENNFGYLKIVDEISFRERPSSPSSL